MRATHLQTIEAGGANCAHEMIAFVPGLEFRGVSMRFDRNEEIFGEDETAEYVYRVASGAMSLEALLIVLMAGTEIFRPLRDLRTVLHQGMVGQSAAEGVLSLLAAKTDAPAAGPHRLSLERTNASIEFDAVRFAYPERTQAALDDITFSITPGERIASRTVFWAAAHEIQGAP